MAGPNGERDDSGMVCVRELPIVANGKFYETVMKPATMHECRPINIRNRNASRRNGNAEMDARRLVLSII